MQHVAWIHELPPHLEVTDVANAICSFIGGAVIGDVVVGILDLGDTRSCLAAMPGSGRSPPCSAPSWTAALCSKPWEKLPMRLMGLDPESWSEARVDGGGGGATALVNASRSPRASSREGWKTALRGSLENTLMVLGGGGGESREAKQSVDRGEPQSKGKAVIWQCDSLVINDASYI